MTSQTMGSAAYQQYVRSQTDMKYRAAAQQARLAHVLSKADTILTGELVKVRFVAPSQSIYGNSLRPPAASWTDGETISFSVDHLHIANKPLTDQDIIHINGLNYHEVAHHLYGPRADTGYGRWVKKNRTYFQTWNVLEDMRIERALIAMYPSVRPFLHSVILKFVVDASRRSHNMETLHLLTYGRRYLPQDIRDAIRGVFRDPSILTRLEALIDEYLLLYFPSPTKEKRAREIVKEVYALMGSAMPASPYGHDHTSNDGVPESGETDRGTQKEALDWADYNESEEEDESSSDSDDDDSEEKGKGKSDSKDDDDSDDESSDDAGDSGAEGDEDDADSDAKGSGDGEGDDDADDDSDGSGGGSGDLDDEDDDDDPDSSGDDDEDGDSEGGSGSKSSQSKDDEDEDDERALNPKNEAPTAGGAGSSHEANRTPAEIRKMIRESMEEVAGDVDVAAEVKSKRDFMGVDDGSILALPSSNYADYDVSPTAKLVSKRFGQELEVLRSESDPGWNKMQPSGRINIMRAMQGADLDVLFDQWDADKMDATRIAAAIAIDSSGSMGWNIDLACEAGWVIKHAIEEIEGVCMMASYDTTSAAIYDAEEPADHSQYRAVAATGGTTVAPCVKALRNALAARRELHKMMFILTDGSFQDAPSAHEELAAAKENGVTVVLIGLGDYAEQFVLPYKDDVSLVVVIKTIGELVPIAKNIVVGEIAAGL